jgi:hypothetical protein
MADKWNLEGVSVDTQNNMTVLGSITANGGFTSVVTEYAATGAIDPTDGFVSLDGTTSGAMTLAVGADGAEMKIVCINADNTVDVDADFGGTTATITFDVGEACSLISQDSVWYIVGNTGALS